MWGMQKRTFDLIINTCRINLACNFDAEGTDKWWHVEGVDQEYAINMVAVGKDINFRVYAIVDGNIEENSFLDITDEVRL